MVYKAYGCGICNEFFHKDKSTVQAHENIPVLDSIDGLVIGWRDIGLEKMYYAFIGEEIGYNHQKYYRIYTITIKKNEVEFSIPPRTPPELDIICDLWEKVPFGSKRFLSEDEFKYVINKINKSESKPKDLQTAKLKRKLILPK